MYKKIIEKVKPELEKTLNYFKKEMQKVRSGRASAGLVEDILVDCFGSRLPIKQLAAISCPETRQIVIQPWSKEYLEPIEKTLSKADLGAMPTVDKEVIRINLPALTGEFREKLLIQITKKSEEIRQTLRKWRDETWKEIQEKERAGEISEDDKFRGKDELQKLIDEYNKKIDEVKDKKENEIRE